MAAAPLLGGAIPQLRLLRLHQATLPVGVCLLMRRPLNTTTAGDHSPAEKVSTTTTTTTYDSSALLRAKSPPPKDSKWENDPDYRKWKEKEAEILQDIYPVTSLIKEILHSDRYLDGERLTAADEKVVVERLLAYHPHSEDKIGCGLDYMMVDRHPQFRQSRCLFVVRTDGGWIDFSYQKCIRVYIRQKYPSHAERFINEHYARGSSGLFLVNSKI